MFYQSQPSYNLFFDYQSQYRYATISLILRYWWKKQEDTSTEHFSEPSSMKNYKHSPTKDSWRIMRKYNRKKYLLWVSPQDLLRVICSLGMPTSEGQKELSIKVAFFTWNSNSLSAILTTLPPSDFSLKSLILMFLVDTSAWICFNKMNLEAKKGLVGPQLIVYRVCWPNFKAFCFRNF